MRLSIALTALIALLTGVLSASCGGGEEAKVTPSPAGTGTPAATRSAPATTPAGPLTLEITSVVPSPARLGDEVVVTFKTSPGAVIGFEIRDGAGQTAAQTMVTAGADGTATYRQVASGARGTWQVEAAVGATIGDLLRLQASPTSGPETAGIGFEVE